MMPRCWSRQRPSRLQTTRTAHADGELLHLACADPGAEQLYVCGHGAVRVPKAGLLHHLLDHRGVGMASNIPPRTAVAGEYPELSVEDGADRIPRRAAYPDGGALGRPVLGGDVALWNGAPCRDGQ